MRLRVLTLAVGILAAGGDAAAFHEKGVANCSGCHLAHGDAGKLVGPSADKGLLIAESPSDVCLVCHARASGQVFGTDPLVPPPEAGAVALSSAVTIRFDQPMNRRLVARWLQVEPATPGALSWAAGRRFAGRSVVLRISARRPGRGFSRSPR